MAYVDTINQGVANLHLQPDDPSSLGSLVGYLNAHGLHASVMDHNGTPSDHKIWINGAAWTVISSNGYLPGTFRWDAYEQVASDGSFDPQTGEPGYVPPPPSGVLWTPGRPTSTQELLDIIHTLQMSGVDPYSRGGITNLTGFLERGVQLADIANYYSTGK